MKDSLKRITAVILLAAATLLVALQCGSIAKKEEAAALLRADASSSCNKMPPDGFFRESFKDISPLAPTHFLVVPKQHFASAAEVTPENEAVVGHIYTVIAKLAREMGFADGYRVVTNVGELAGQTVHHIHFHVLSGKQLGSFN